MDRTEKAIYRRIFSISIPSLAGFLGLVFFDIIDIFWIEKLGARVVAGVASAGFITWALGALVVLTTAGCSSLVSQFNGAGNQRSAWDVSVQASWFSFLVSLLIVVIFQGLVERPFVWMGLEPDTVSVAVDYFTIMLWGTPFMFLDMWANSVFNAYGDTKISNIVMIFCLFVNIALDPVMMFGMCGCPAMGVKGAAYATVISYAISMSLRCYFLRKRAYIPPLKYFASLRFSYYTAILKIGLPPAAAGLFWSLVYPFLTKLIAPFGMIPVSAVGICHRLESFPYYVAAAFGVAMTSLVGYNVGSRENEKIDLIVSAGIKVVTIILFPFILLFIAFPGQLMGFMSSDPALIAYGVEYLFIVGLFEICMGWEQVFSATFTGLGITYPALLITMPLTIGRIPLAWFFAYYLNMGTNGIWLSISLTTGLKGLGLYVLYRYMQRKTGNFASVKLAESN